ncbi:MAG: hypothetical protein JWN62_889 [Acidimicrobiales bacterium]|nr:hypothetical protein [Acidimicrobiales bacterium]
MTSLREHQGCPGPPQREMGLDRPCTDQLTIALSSTVESRATQVVDARETGGSKLASQTTQEATVRATIGRAVRGERSLR